MFSTCGSLQGVLSKPSISTILISLTEAGSLVKSNLASASFLSMMYLLTCRFFCIIALTSSCSMARLIFLRSVLADISIFPIFSSNLEMMNLVLGILCSTVLARMCSAV